MDVATGASEDHPTPLPLDASQSPAVAPPTMTEPGFTGPRDQASLQGGVRDLTGERLADLGSIEAACQSAQSSGMGAENDRRHHYAAAADYVDAVVIPEVPANAVPPSSSDLYPYSGDEPTPAGA